MDISQILSGYDTKNLTIASLGGHSALDVCAGAAKEGFKTLVVARKGREMTYEKYYKKKNGLGCIDSVITLPLFQDIIEKKQQDRLRKENVIFVHNRYFWVYFDDFSKVENEFNIPIFGSRHLLKLEERDQLYTQYDLLADAGIRTPKIFKSGKDIDRPVLVKASEATRGYERGFFVVASPEQYESEGTRLEKEKKITKDWKRAVIEEFIVGAPVNFNFFYSPLTGELELLGTDTRRQTNLDGYLRMTGKQQEEVSKFVPLKMVETGHIAVTIKESLLEKAFDLGEKFVAATQKISKKVDPAQKGIIGPFALQGAVVAEEGREDIVIFDVSLRVPGSPGIAATPYGMYRYGRPMSMGERIAMEIRAAADAKVLEKILT